MTNTTLEIFPSPEEIPPYPIESQANRVTLLRRRFAGRQLEISIEANGRLRGWVITAETTEVMLKGFPTYLIFQRATQLLNQSYLKFQKGAIEILPKGLGGMKRSCPSSVLGSDEAKICEEEVLQLVEAISDDEERKVVLEAVKGLLKNDPEKKDLNLSENQIGTEGVQALGIALQVNHTLQSLDFEESGIVATGSVRALAAALKVNQSLQLLNLNKNQIGTAGTQVLGTALQVNQSLQSLNFENNQIGAAGAQAIGAVLQVNQSLQKLNLKMNEIGDAGAQAIGAALQVNQTLQKLDLGINKIGDAGAQVLGATLEVNHTFWWLNLGSNRIGDAGAQALGAALLVNQSLWSLLLRYNGIGDAGAQALGAALLVNQSLRSLDLMHNHIGDAGAQALGAALLVNQSLRSLDFMSNHIGTVGAQALGEALQVNQSLQSLNLWNNGVGTAGAQALATALQVNQSIRLLELELGENQIGDAGAQALGAALQVNQSLQSLNLWKNQIGAVGAQALGTALQVNQSLRSLNLLLNRIDDTGAQPLKAALQVNQSIQSLDLSHQLLGFSRNRIRFEGIVTIQQTMQQIVPLLQANKQIAILFQQQITQVQNFLKLHENNDGILLEHLPQLKKLLSKWHTDSKNIIPSLQETLRQSAKTNLNDRYKEKLEGIIKNLTNRLHNLWLESFEKKIAALSNEYVMGKESIEERNVDLGHALYETWLTFLGFDCPNWIEDHIQSLLPFSVLLDIAEGGDKQDVSELKNPHFLFQRVLSFRNESKDSLFSLTNQSKKS